MATAPVALVAAVTTFLAACSPGAVPVSQSPTDPSNPHAAEGARVASAADHQHADHAASPTPPPADGPAAEATYVCPMHPEVTSAEPGSCPKCHMTLEPKK